jgi:hypothetical protein
MVEMNVQKQRMGRDSRVLIGSDQGENLFLGLVCTRGLSANQKIAQDQFIE